MYRGVFVGVALVVLSTQAQARHHPYPIQYFRQSMAMAPSDERVVGNRPSGCPNAFCGCEASLYRFGHIVPELNLASNWRRFPRAAPAPGMAAVRSGHVMILQQQVAGDVWTVHDGNSGGHVTREHPRSIAGYTIVDPSGGSALASNTPSPRLARQARAPSPTRVTRETRMSLAQNGGMTPLFAN
jgi:hypothetical protein